MSATSGQSRGFMHVASGAGLGAFVGLLVGLSTAPVVAGLVGALSAGVLALLSIPGKDAGAGEGSASSRERVLRVMGFGLVGSVAVLFGIYLRATDAFGRTPKELVGQWHDAGLADSIAVPLVAYTRTGMLLSNVHVSEKVLPVASGATSTALFAAKPEDCRKYLPSRYPDANEAVNAWRIGAQPWADAGVYVATLPEARRAAKLSEYWAFQCS